MSSDIHDLLSAAEAMVADSWSAQTNAADAESNRVGGSAQSALDRVAQIGAALLDDRQTELFGDVIQTFVHLSRAADGTTGSATARVESRNVPERLRDISTRVYTLGALAVIRSTFGVVPNIVLQSRHQSTTHRWWLRETVTLLARGGSFEPKSLLPPIGDYVAEHDVFYRRFHRNKDDVVNALCQFDFLQCVVSMASTGSVYECYPNFGAFFNWRTEPVVESLVKRAAARSVVPELSDDQLAYIIVQLDELASNAFFAYAGWLRSSWRSDVIKSFLQRHAPMDR